MYEDKDDIEDFYREAVDNYGQSDMPDLWGDIENSLDIEEVWENLDTSLDRRKRRGIIFLWTGQVAALILFLIVGNWLVREMNDWSDRNSSETQWTWRIDSESATELPEKRMANHESTDSCPPEPNGPVHVDIPGQPPSPQRQLAFDGLQPQKDQPRTPPLQPVDTLQARTPFLTDAGTDPPAQHIPMRRQRAKLLPNASHPLPFMGWHDPAMGEFPDPESMMEPELPEAPEFRPAFFTGVVAGFKNQWLLNPETFQGFQGDQLDATRADFSGALGVQAGLMFTARLGIQLDYIFLSSSGQKYIDYINGKTSEREINLHYQKLIMSSRFQRADWYLLGIPAYDYFQAGFYAGRLTRASQQRTNNGISDLFETYHKWDYGLFGGYEIELAVMHQLRLVGGVRIAQGLRNIYRGTASRPRDLFRTRNASGQLTIGLRYFLK